MKINRIFVDNKKKVALFIAIVLTLLSFYNDYLIFNVQGKENLPPPYKTSWIWCLKALYFFLVYKAIGFIASGKLKHIKFILVYFGIIFIFYIALYPGVWSGDDIITLGSLTEGSLYYWQNWLSSAYFYLCMMLFPSPSGIVFVQVIIISLIAGHIVGTAYDFLGRVAYFLYLPLLMPSVIDSNLLPIRASICAFIELYIVFELIFWHKSPNADRSTYKMVWLGVVSALLSAWRPEKIINLLVVLLFFQVIERVGIKKLLPFVLCSFVVMFSFMEVQSNGLANNYWISSITGNKMSEKYLYSLSGFVTPMGELVQKVINNPQYEDVISDIDKKISVQRLANEKLGAFWNGGLKQLDKQDLSDLRKDYIYLAVHNFSAFFKERWTNFALANGLLGNVQNFPGCTAHLFDNVPEPGVRPMYEEFKSRYIFNNPPEIIQSSRVNLISFLQPRKTSDVCVSSYPVAYFIFYNCIIPLMVAFGCFVWAVMKKSGVWFLLLSGLLGEFAIVVLSAPGPTFMYFYSTQLICWSIFTYILLEERNNKGKYSLVRSKGIENER